MTSALDAARAAPPGGRRTEPPLDELLPAVASALEREFGTAAGEPRVTGAAKRTYSRTWEIEVGSERYILKWLPFRAAREAELASVCRHIFFDHPHVRTPRVACNPTGDTFLVQKLDGVPLQVAASTPRLWGFASWLESRRRMLTTVGEWLRRFHDVAVSAGQRPLAGVQSYVRHREAMVAALPPDLAVKFRRTMEDTVSRESVRVHGDFAPHNVLVAGQSVAVIDFAGITEFERETRCFDAAVMVVGLEESWRLRLRNPLRFFPSPINQLIASFLLASGVAADPEPFPVCYAVRHLTRAYTKLQRKGGEARAVNWHLDRVRLALERPDAIRRLIEGNSR